MNPVELPYGTRKVSFQLPPGWSPDILRPKAISPAAAPEWEIASCLDHPLGGKRLEDFRGAPSVAIAVSDETRPVPNKIILPILLDRLERMGFSPKHITFLIASGLHPPPSPSRFSNIIPQDILGKYRILAHDARDPHLQVLGKTTRGTPVHVNPFFHRAKVRLAIGLIDPHQFVGYTGGVKCAAIGLAGAKTIEANHSLLSDPQAVVGEIQANPVRQDIEEVGKLMGIHFVINVVLDEANHIIKAFAGEPVTVEEAGSGFCRTVYEIEATGDYDVVIASPGGYPKDINLYQAQKGLAHATPLVRQGGVLILLAECPDGHGEETFYETMKRYRNPQELIQGFLAEPFRVGAHKAFLWARSLNKAQVYLVSAMGEEMGRQFMTLPARNLQEVFEKLYSQYPTPPRIAIMPKANSSYAKVRS